MKNNTDKSKSVTINVVLPVGLKQAMDELVEQGLYSSVSEVMREGIREIIQKSKLKFQNLGNLDERGTLVQDVKFKDQNGEEIQTSQEGSGVSVTENLQQGVSDQGLLADLPQDSSLEHAPVQWEPYEVNDEVARDRGEEDRVENVTEEPHKTEELARG